MPIYVRWREPGATYFFTVVTYRRQRILTRTACREYLRLAFREVQRELPFEMPVIVLLPDHMDSSTKR